MTAPVTTPWMTVEQVAKEAQYSTKTVLRALNSNDLKGSRPTGGRCWRIKRTDFEKWMASRNR